MYCTEYPWMSSFVILCSVIASFGVGEMSRTAEQLGAHDLATVS